MGVCVCVFVCVHVRECSRGRVQALVQAQYEVSSKTGCCRNVRQPKEVVIIADARSRSASMTPCPQIQPRILKESSTHTHEALDPVLNFLRAPSQIHTCLLMLFWCCLLCNHGAPASSGHASGVWDTSR
jgi:hypothetical protein